MSNHNLRLSNDNLRLSLETLFPWTTRYGGVWGPPDDRGAQGDPTSESGGVGAILGRLAKIVDNLRLSFDIPDVLGTDIILEIIHEEMLSLLMFFHVTIPTEYS